MAPNVQANGAPFAVEKREEENECSKQWNQRRARLVMKRTEGRSQLIQPKQEESLLQMDPNELVLGNLLGTGAFSTVYELSGGHIDCQSNDDDDSPHYAIKVLKSTVDEDAIVDFVMEQKYLVALTVRCPHPNIIRLHGISTAKSCSLFEKPCDSFLIMEKVDETLVERMDTWRHEKIDPNSNYNDKDCWLERLDAALQLSSALSHLHRLKLLYRDLKPDNIGFIGSTLKLFDFGMIKELHTSSATGMYCMSGSIAGTLRYMAPEVLLQRPYSLFADVYSFGVVLWQILSLEPSFLMGVTSKRKCIKQVVQQHARPVISDEWPDAIKDLLETCWARHANKRPTTKHIYTVLKNEIENQKAQE